VTGVPGASFILLVHTIRGVDSVRLDTWVMALAAHGVFFAIDCCRLLSFTSAERGWAAIRRLWPVCPGDRDPGLCTIIADQDWAGGCDEPAMGEKSFLPWAPGRFPCWATIHCLDRVSPIAMAIRGWQNGAAKLDRGGFSFLYRPIQTIICAVFGFLLLAMLLPVWRGIIDHR